MTVRDRFDSDAARATIRRRAQLHFQLTFAWGVRIAMKYDPAKAQYPVLAAAICTPEADEELRREIDWLGRGAYMADTLRVLGYR